MQTCGNRACAVENLLQLLLRRCLFLLLGFFLTTFTKLLLLALRAARLSLLTSDDIDDYTTIVLATLGTRAM